MPPSPLLISHIYFGSTKYVSFMSLSITRSRTKPHGFQTSIGLSGTSMCAVCSMHQSRLSASHLTATSLFSSMSPHYSNPTSIKLKNQMPSFCHLPKSLSIFLILVEHRDRYHRSHSWIWWNPSKIHIGWSSHTYTLYIRHIQMKQITYAKRLPH